MTDKHNQRLRAIDAFLEGLTTNDVEKMRFAEDIVLTSPLDPEHPLIGKGAAIQFLKTRVFPSIPVRRAEAERHIVDGDCVGTLWKATFAPMEGREVEVSIFDFFRIADGKIKELRP